MADQIHEARLLAAARAGDELAFARLVERHSAALWTLAEALAAPGSDKLAAMAYDDARGVTAAFNLNMLAVVNRELDADFALDAFAHEATFNPALQRIEMRLRSLRAQVVRVGALGLEVPFLAGESILTEISRKFTREGVARAYAEARLRLRGWLTDADEWYAISLAGVA